jgi:photosystem II stability/assembly factor-like uncharacterized protein
VKPFYFLTVILAAICLHAQTPVWTQFPNSPVGGGNFRNDDISFADLTNGWSARGTDGLYHTTNCGQSWFSVTPHIVTNVAHFRSIGFASPTRGWTGNLGPGSYDANVTDTNLLYETFDGGNTWNVVQAINNSGMAGFCAMHIPDIQHIYGVGRVRGPAYFVKSVDGGNSWYVTNLTAGGVMGGLMDVYFMNTNLGFTVGMDTNSFYSPPYFGSIARTTNGGLSWQVMATVRVTNSYFWKMSWPSTNVGYASLQQNNPYSSFVFYKTTDGGQTWVSNGISLSAIGSPPSFELQGVGFVSTNEGWLGGGSLAAPYNFIHTTDGGLTWTAMGYDNANNLNRFRFVNSTLGYLSGIKLHVYHIPPTGVISPVSVITNLGSAVTFTATNYGTPPMSLQWRLNGTNIPGATTNFYTITNVQAANLGNYDLVVSDFSGSGTSSIAPLAIFGPSPDPTILTQPKSQLFNKGDSVTLTVGAGGTAPFAYQWRMNGIDLSGATQSGFTFTNGQPTNAGNYSVVVTNNLGSVTSAVAVVTFQYSSDFDGFSAPVTVTDVGTTNGFNILFDNLPEAPDFTAIFGFDYSQVTFPTNIPPAPHNTGHFNRGLYLTVNKNYGFAAAVNLYPTNQVFAGNYALKFDVWINLVNTPGTTEHVMFGINHSGTITNRVGVAGSDGLFFEFDGDGGVSASATAERDFSVFRGSGAGIPFLALPANTIFGPAPLLSTSFDNTAAGFISLFPSQFIPSINYSTADGAAAFRWISVEVRQEFNLITWLLNGTLVAQFTNTTSYTNGTVLIGYNDNFDSLGNSNNYAVFDDIQVVPIILLPVQIQSPQLSGNNFNFSFATDLYESYSVQWTTNLLGGNWMTYGTYSGGGNITNIVIPLPVGISGPQFFRVNRQ